MSPSPDTTPRLGRVPRLYLEEALRGPDVVLGSRHAHYLRQVLRLKRGHSLVVFDGRGNECLASITRLTRETAVLRVGSATAALPESDLCLVLLQAVAKGAAMDLVVQKATEMGVRSIVPVVTEFCVVRLDEQRIGRRLEHWRRIAQSACEQSGRHEPTRIHAPQELAACLAGLPAPSARLALDPRADDAFAQDVYAVGSGSPLCLLVGPEGGLSERDLQLASRARFTRVSLGPRILRADTAAIAACTLAQGFWGDLLGP